MRELLLEQRPKVLLLDLSSVPTLEFTALRVLGDAAEKLPEYGTELWVAALTPEVLELVNRSGLGSRLGRERMFFTLELAVERFQTVALSSVA